MECMKDNFVKGQILDGRFRTIAPLNHGSFGMVFLAHDTLTGKEVAIKCSMKHSTVDSAVDLSGEDEELRCHQTLQHDHLVNLIHHFETPSHRYLVLEYCSHGDLYEAIRLGRGPLQTEHVRDFMLQLVSAVEYMHSRGLYHRDIKPENIFLAQDGGMKLGDFGLATGSVWSYESCVGSDRYMAPEQYDPTATGYSPAQADVWAIGICLLNILFSRNPFTVPTESDVLFADFRRDRQSLFDVFPNMSGDTFEILSHSLAIVPEQRSLVAVRNALTKAICFTTDDEILDDFCTEERDSVQASANREPLRTPSLQSPSMTQTESFPWAKALHSSPLNMRQLSAIPDVETYEEDLFADSYKDSTSSWGLECQNTPSVASVLDSGLGASLESVQAHRSQRRSLGLAHPVPLSGSLPAPSLAKPIPSMSMIFGDKDHGVSKSWSDLLEEGTGDLVQVEPEVQTDTARQDNRVHDGPQSVDECRHGGLQILRDQSPSARNIVHRQKPGIPERLVQAASPDENSYVFVDPSSATKSLRDRPDYLDKWAELGVKRRNGMQGGESLSSSVTKKRPTMMSWRKALALPSSVHERGLSQRRDSRGAQHARPAWLDVDWRREQQQQHPRAKPVHEVGDDDELEWVGGWHAFHL